MDPESVAPRQVRRSARQSMSGNAKVVNFEPTPRGPLKRTKSPSKSVPAINGDKDAENGSDDEGSPNKKSRLQTGEVLAGGDGSPNDTQEPMETLEENEEQKAEIMKDPINHSHRPQNKGPLGDANFNPCVALGQRCSLSHSESENLIKYRRVEPPKKDPTLPLKSTTEIRPKEKTYDKHRVTSMGDYKRKMEAKITEKNINHYVQIHSPTSVTTTTRQRTNVPPTQKRSVTEKKQVETKKTVSPKSAGFTSKGFLRYSLQLVLLMLLGVGLFLAFKNLPTSQRTKDCSTSDVLKLFEDKLSRVAMNYPGQRPELWKRSKIHIVKHLNSSNPTEPVSMILTAGVRAEKTLHCLAQSLACAFSFSLNASVIHINGSGKTNLDSDEVKEDIDNQLITGFEGDKVAAVIHRFEELPPSSTLIFYRYCDHETAAYKRVFLLFTVLLPEEDLAQQSLQDVEEMVRDHITERFVGSETAFNKMDADKFSGLWSRIAHLIVPVAYEGEVEQRGC